MTKSSGWNAQKCYVYIQFGFLLVYAAALVGLDILLFSSFIHLPTSLCLAVSLVGISFIALPPAIILYLWGLRLRKSHPAESTLILASRLSIVPLLLFPVSIASMFLALWWPVRTYNNNW